MAASGSFIGGMALVTDRLEPWAILLAWGGRLTIGRRKTSGPTGLAVVAKAVASKGNNGQRQ